MLAIARLVSRVMVTAISSVVLRGVHSASVEVQALHARSKKRHTIGTSDGRRRRSRRRVTARSGRIESVSRVGTTRARDGGSRDAARRAMGADNAVGSRSKGRSATLKRTLDRVVGTGLFTSGSGVVVGQFAIVARGNGAGGNSAHARIMILQMLLGMVVGTRAAVGREGALQARGRVHDRIAGGRYHGSRIVGEVLQIDGMTDSRRAWYVDRRCCAVELRRIDGRQRLSCAVPVHIAPAVG